MREVKAKFSRAPAERGALPLSQLPARANFSRLAKSRSSEMSPMRPLLFPRTRLLSGGNDHHLHLDGVHLTGRVSPISSFTGSAHSFGKFQVRILGLPGCFPHAHADASRL